MRRRASPSARTIRIAPTVPCVPVDRVGVPVPRSYPPETGPVTGETAPARAWKVDRSVAQGRPEASSGDARMDTQADGARRLAVVAGVLLAVAAFTVYIATQTDRFYDHFVWQAAAFLEGQAAIRYPVEMSDSGIGNAYFQDVLPVGLDGRRRAGPDPVPAAARARPAAVRRGLGPHDRRPDDLHGSRRCRRGHLLVDARPAAHPVDRPPATVIFFAFGTVFWYSAQLATTWYQAHIVAVGLAMLAVGLGAPGGSGAPRTTSRSSTRRSARACRRHRHAGERASRSIAASSPSVSCSGWPAPHGCRSSSRRRSSCSSGPASHGGGAAGRPGWARSSRSRFCSHTTSRPREASSIRPTSTSTSSRRGPTRASATTPPGRSRTPATSRRICGIMFLSIPDILPDRLPDTLGTIDEPLCTDRGRRTGPVR